MMTNWAQEHPWCSSRYLAAFAGGGGSRGVPVLATARLRSSADTTCAWLEVVGGIERE